MKHETPHTDIDTPHVEISATGSTTEERLATLLAFQEHVPIVMRKADGAVFARMLPDTPSDAERDEISPDA